jgi:hypothetical protein
MSGVLSTGDVCIKVGDTLLMTWTFQNDDGSAVDLTSVTLASQVRDPLGNLVATLAPVKAATPLNVATVQQPTVGWPVGLLRCDVSVTSSAGTQLSETFGIRVNRAVTQ